MSRDIKNTSVHFNDEEKQIRSTETGKIVFTRYNNKTLGMYIADNRLLYARVCDKAKACRGDYYIARVNNISKNIQACFVNISKETACFLSLKEAEKPILLNRQYDGRLLQGDVLIVKVIKPASKLKQASVTCNFELTEEEKNKFIHQSLYTKVISGGDVYKDFIDYSVCLAKSSSMLESFNQNNIEFDEGKDEIIEIITDQDDLYTDICNSLAYKSLYNIKLYKDKLSLNSLYSINTKMETALNKRIWLKSGAFLFIEHTEALTVIDVNSGKFESNKGNNEYVLAINMEAAREIMLQLILRNISGIVIVDFINMKSNEDNMKLLEYMKELSVIDPVTTKVIDMTTLGLVELTRQKQLAPLYEQLKDN